LKTGNNLRNKYIYKLIFRRKKLCINIFIVLLKNVKYGRALMTKIEFRTTKLKLLLDINYNFTSYISMLC